MSRREDITERILSASVDEFILKGLNSASMENIAKVAVVSKRTLYKYYSNKDEIFDQIISKLLETFSKHYNFKYSPDISIEDQLTGIINIKVNHMTSEDYMKISKLILSELLKSKELSIEHLEEFSASENVFINWINDAKKDGKVSSDQASELIANQFHSILKGQIFYPVVFGIAKLSQDDINKSKEITLNFFLNSFCR